MTAAEGKHYADRSMAKHLRHVHGWSLLNIAAHLGRTVAWVKEVTE